MKSLGYFGAMGRELLLFVGVVAGVVIIGITSMYWKALYLAVEDVLPQEQEIQVAVADKVFEVQEFTQIEETGESLDIILAGISYRGAQAQKSLTIQDYVDAKLNEYTFSFNDLPPGQRLLIPSIKVDAPIVDVAYASDEKLQNGDFDKELREGVVKYPFTVEPGNTGNSLLFGHSSVTTWEDAKNPFGYVFYKLQDLAEGERFDVIWDGQLYSYQIDNKIIKEPSEVGAEIEKYDQVGENFLTLMACYPRLTDSKRILVRAKQLKNKESGGANVFAMN